MRTPLVSYFASSVSLFFSSCVALTVFAQDQPQTKDDKIAAQRLELMQKRIADIRVSSRDSSVEEIFPTEFASKPILRYTDPARGYVSAAVWKLGDQGRPKALITTELHRLFRGSPSIVYEYLSLTPARFSAASSDFRWTPDGTSLAFAPVPDSPAPDETAQRRLLQMRAISKRFAGNESADKELYELRLLPQPVDRYTPSSVERADGAIFLMTYGTNPEAAILIESDGKQWNYAVGRLTGAQMVSLTIDGKPAWQIGPAQYGATQPYTASNASADIPGVAANGTEIKDE